MSSKKNNNVKNIKIKNKKEALKVLNQKSNRNNKVEKKSIKKKYEKNTTKLKVGKKLNDKPQEITITPAEIKNIKINKKKYTVEDEKKQNELYKKYTKTEEKPNKYKQNIKPIYDNNIQKNKNGNIGKKIKNTIFEEVDYETIKKENQINNRRFGKKSLIIGIVLIIASILLLIAINISSRIKKITASYNKYEIGEIIYLNDNSKWYVINDNGKSSEVVTLLRASQLDINEDGIFDDNDKLPFSNTGKTEYDTSDEGTAPYYIEKIYKKYLNEEVVKIQQISLMTSKEFIKVRDYMNFGYEWSEPNFLANDTLDVWWIDTVQSDKIFAVGPTGSYRLFETSKKNYVRPTITVKKDLLN